MNTEKIVNEKRQPALKVAEVIACTSCDHKNGFLTEVLTATHSRVVENGSLSKIGNNEIGDLQYYQFECTDCQKIYKYRNGENNWIQKYVDALLV